MSSRRDGWLLIAFSFLLYSALQVPVPGTNEAHYLAKARHYWDPTWCGTDFFLESADAHLVFYQVFGWITLWLSFAQVAWLGRLLSLTLLALSWQALGERLGLSRTAAVWSAWLFLCLTAIGSFSGEWVVGGFESKVPAYALALWGLAFACQRQWASAGALTGLAVSFHPVVGGWFAVAECGALLIVAGQSLRRGLPLPRAGVLRAAVLFAVCAAPGLLPALQLVLAPGVTETEAVDADWVQVFQRLAHHLDPMQFSRLRYLGYGSLLLVWTTFQVWEWRQASRDVLSEDTKTAASAPDGPGEDDTGHAWSYFRYVVWMSILIAFAGVVLGWGPRPAYDMPLFAIRTKLLKFYPFRLFDVLLPLAVSFQLARTLQNAVRRQSAPRWLTLVPLMCLLVSLFFPVPSRNPSRMSPAMLADWKEACVWIRSETDQDVLVLTPRLGYSFKWYAQRAEFVSPKDCPQDPAGILEWFHRMRLVRRWEAEARRDGRIDRTHLQRLRDEYGIDVVVYPHLRPLKVPSPADFRNEYFSVHRLDRPSDEAGASDDTADTES